MSKLSDRCFVSLFPLVGTVLLVASIYVGIDLTGPDAPTGRAYALPFFVLVFLTVLSFSLSVTIALEARGKNQNKES